MELINKNYENCENIFYRLKISDKSTFIRLLFYFTVK